MSGRLFIVNPRSGAGRHVSLLAEIEAWINTQHNTAEIKLTKAPGHAAELAAEAASQGYTTVVAVGGDGSVHEVAGALAGKDTALGIIPCGSGNGVARHFGIPLNTRKALAILKNENIIRIDSCTLNKRRFIMLAGAGFDAYIAAKFAASQRRGLTTYAKLSATGYFTYRPQRFRITVDDLELEREALMVVAANCAQFGNNALIAPGASATDGLLNVSILHKAPVHRLPLLTWKLFTGGLTGDREFEMYAGSKVIIEQEDDFCQVDGEFFRCGRRMEIGIEPLSLNLIVPAYV